MPSHPRNLVVKSRVFGTRYIILCLCIALKCLVFIVPSLYNEAHLLILQQQLSYFAVAINRRYRFEFHQYSSAAWLLGLRLVGLVSNVSRTLPKIFI